MKGSAKHVIAWLGERGFDLNVPDCDGDTALAALFFGDKGRASRTSNNCWDWPDVARALVEAGADPGRFDGAGRTVMHRAVHVGDVGVVSWLHGRDATLIAAPDRRGATPLHVACRIPGAANEVVKQGSIEWLLAHGGPDLLLPRDETGATPLKCLAPDSDAVDAKLKKWVAAWLREARKQATGAGALPPPPPYAAEDGRDLVGDLPRDGRARGFQSQSRPANDVFRKEPGAFKPELHAIPIRDQYERFDAIDYAAEARDDAPSAAAGNGN